MDGSEGVVLAIVAMAFVGLITGLISYGNGQDGVRSQAIAAGVACYEAKPDGSGTVFKWHCK